VGYSVVPGIGGCDLPHSVQYLASIAISFPQWTQNFLGAMGFWGARGVSGVASGVSGGSWRGLTLTLSDLLPSMLDIILPVAPAISAAAVAPAIWRSCTSAAWLGSIVGKMAVKRKGVRATPIREAAKTPKAEEEPPGP